MALLQRLHQFLSKPSTDPAIVVLYHACVAQARQPSFYQTLGVPDTLEGRFDLLLLHVFMVMHRLGKEVRAKQQLFDFMFADMDRSLREMGVGDMSVGKKIRPMISAFYGRGQAYEKALLADNEMLAAALGRNLYSSAEIGADVLTQMTEYVRHSIAELEQQQLESLLAGQINFPAPIIKQRA